jgi:hypothetical protein
LNGQQADRGDRYGSKIDVRSGGSRSNLGLPFDLLRDELDLTGTEKGGDHGQYGACTVLMDGVRQLVLEARRTRDQTIEGPGATLQPFIRFKLPSSSTTHSNTAIARRVRSAITAYIARRTPRP